MVPMSEQNDETTVRAEPAAPAAPARPAWRDRVYGLRSVAAVALAGLIIGGGAGAAIHAATADDGRDGPGRTGFQRGPGGGQRPGPPNGGFPAPPAGVPGQTQPTTPPTDDADPG